jgi:opacity protein-like surface antigen
MNSGKWIFRIISCFGLVFLTSTALQAQATDGSRPPAEISLKVIVGSTSVLEFERNYSVVQADKADVVSDGSYMFALRANYTQSFHPRLRWDIGLEAGLDSYHLQVVASEAFLNTGFNRPYNVEATFFDLAYAAVLMGLKYQLPISPRSALSFNAGGRFTFYMPIGIGVGFGLIPSSGTQIDVFDAEMKSNPDNQLIVSPEFGLDYAYHFPRSNFVLLAGFNTSFSRETTLRGNYLIFGDQEVLKGTLSKEMMFFRLGLGVAYRLR